MPRRILLSYLIFFLSTAAVFGQNDPTFDDIDSSLLMYDLDELVVTAQYRPTHYKNVMHNIEIIDEAKLIKRGVTQLDQALLLSPAIRIEQDPILGTTVRMRGISSRNVSILIDGVPMIGRQGGGIDLSQIPMQNVVRIEIVEGPLSNIYGSNAAGGVINIITRQSQLKTWSINASTQLESIGTQNHQASVGFSKGKFRAEVSGRYFEYDQFAEDSMRLRETVTLPDGRSFLEAKYPWNPKVQHSLGASLKYKIDDNNTIMARYSYNKEAVTDFGSLRRVRSDNPYANDLFFDTYRRDVSLTYKGKIHDKYFIDFVVANNKYDRVTSEKRFYVKSREFDTLFQTVDTNYFESYFSRLNFAYPINDHWEVTAGLNYNFEKGGGDRIEDNSRPDSTVADFQEIAAYSEIKYTPFKNLSFAASGRMTFHNIYTSQFTPALQARYNFSKKWKLNLGIAQGYRNPSLKELYLEFIDINHYIIGNPNLKPEISTDYQATLSFFPIEEMDFSLNAYKTNIKDRIILSEFETLRYTYDNLDVYDVYGFQFDFKFNHEYLRWTSNFNLGYWSTNLEREEAPNYAKVFDMNHTMELKFPFVDIDIMVNYRLAGKQPIYRIVDEEVTINEIEAVRFLDSSLSRSFWKSRIRLTTGIRNILNKQSANVTGIASSGAHSSTGSRLVDRGRSYFINLGLAF